MSETVDATRELAALPRTGRDRPAPTDVAPRTRAAPDAIARQARVRTPTWLGRGEVRE